MSFVNRVALTLALYGSLCVTPTRLLGDADTPPPTLASKALERPATESPKLNLLVITIDTLRADKMSMYGHERITTPQMDAFGRTATVFENSYSHTSWTFPSMSTKG